MKQTGKSIYTLVLILFTIAISKGQFVITAAHNNPTIGDKYNEYYADTTGVLPGPSGANVIWKFKNLNIQTSYISHSFIPPVSYTGCLTNLYPTATVQDTVSLTFYNTTNNSLNLLGNCGGGYVSSEDTIFVYPFAYGSNYQNNWGSSYQCQIGVVTSFRNKTYDSYGTLFLPNITYYNVARVVDVVQYNGYWGQGSGTKVISHTFKWYENSIKFPVLTITIEKDSSYIHGFWSGVFKITKKVFVNDGSISVGINTLDVNNNGLLVYPNPFKDFIHIKNANRNETYELISTIGQSIWKGNSISEKDFSFLATGLYFLKVDSRGSSRTLKLLKQE